MQPGETITPGTQPAPEQAPEPPEVPTQAPVEQVQPPVAPSEPEPAPTWQFTANDGPADVAASQPQVSAVSWTASEYIAHNKGMSWFIGLGLALFILVAGIYLTTKDITTPIMVAIAGLTFGVFAGRAPRVLKYVVDAKGITIGDKFYAYSDFRSFDISDDSALPAIMLIPLKRFLPPITVFYDEKEEDNILNVLGSYLPHEEQKPDAVDRLMRRIRF